uniref:Uncharacterized protein n=1 Tax=Kalanchoe fedtschenkoi TaxID=63787 RepID=A0A7N0UVJ3_KALFE
MAMAMEAYTIPGLILIATVWWVIKKLKKSSRLPPSPFGLPIIGHLHLIAPIPHQALHKLSMKHGPLMHINLGSVPSLVVSSAEMAKECLKTHEACFLNRPHIAAVDFLTYKSADFSFAPYGPYWKFMNKLCMTELLGGRTLERLHPIRQEERRNLMRLVLEKASAGESVDLGRELIKMTNNVITRMLMGQRCCDYDDDVASLVKEVVVLTGRFNLADFIWFCKNLDLQRFGKRLKDVRLRFDTMMDKIIKRHEEARKLDADRPKDILHMLLDIKEDATSEVTLTMENIKAFILDIFSAGTDTSAITTEWALAELINHPSIMEKARQEIDCVVGKGRLVEESDIPNLPYIQAITKETLRLHPTGPLTIRESSERCSIGGYDIPAKTRLFVNSWAIGRDARYWDEPLEFKPERFVGEGAKKIDIRGQYFELLPFGSGRRMCPGTSLALLVVQAALANLVQCFDWKGGKVSMDEGVGFTLPRAHPLVCVPVARLHPFPCV